MTNSQMFKQFAQMGAKMDALKALDLLIKAYISLCGVSIGLRTVVYTAAEVWRYWRLPMHPNNPLTMEHIETVPFVESMPVLCKDYNPDEYDKYDIAGCFDEKMLKQLCKNNLDFFDNETTEALCWGINNLPSLNDFFWETESDSIEKRMTKAQKKREHIQKLIEKQ